MNKAFGALYEIHLLGQRMKKWNRKAYYAAKYALMVAIVGVIVISALR